MNTFQIPQNQEEMDKFFKNLQNSQFHQFQQIPKTQNESASDSQTSITENQLIQMLNKNKDFVTKKLSDLKIGTPYKVKSFKTINTRNGKACVVHLMCGVLGTTMIDGVQEFDVFLPSRYNDIPPKENVDNIYMTYEGLKKTANTSKEYHHINFN